MEKKTIVFRNMIQVALWDEEILGQLSDGFWENARPFDHWRSWSEAEATFDTSPTAILGRNFHVDKKNYNFTAPLLLEAVGDRMLEICQRVAGKDFTMKMMRRELNDMKLIIKMWR